jgi:hypothetical protein
MPSVKLGVSDKVVIQDPQQGADARGTWSGTVIQIDHVLRNRGAPHGGYEYNAFIQLDGGATDYRDIVLQGWALYYRNTRGIVEKYYISEYNKSQGTMKLCPYDQLYNLNGLGLIDGKLENIVSILISTNYFTVAPVHQTNLSIERFPV